MSDASSEQEDDERSRHSSSEEAHDDSDNEQQSHNKRKLLKVMKKLKHLKRTVGQHETKIRYHGPYHDSWGERFFSPKQFIRQSLTGSGNHGGQKRRSPWKNVGVRYQFNADEMNGTKLMKNLSWITRTNDILSRITTDDDDDNKGHDDHDERRQNNKMGGGCCKEDDSIGEHELRKALPEMTRTLKNWAVHGQCLGNMVECYRHNNPDYTPKQRSEIGHFFNTASNILDTIGSMTEDSILHFKIS